MRKGVDNVATMWYNSVTETTTKGDFMSNKVKIHISLNEEVYKKGKEMADQMGIPFSTLISVLISNNANNKTKAR